MRGNNNELNISGLPIWLFVIPPLLLVFAPIYKWPNGYYQLLRLIVCIAAGVIAFSEYKANKKSIAVLAGLIALIFNPLILIDFDKSIWGLIDYGVAVAWVYFLWKKGLRPDLIAVIFGIPVGLIILCYVGIAVDELQKDYAEHNRRKQHAAFRAAEDELALKYSENIEIIKFSFSDYGTTINLTVKNTGDTDLQRISSNLFFVSSDGKFLGKEEVEFCENCFSESSPVILKANSIEELQKNIAIISRPKGVDLSKTRIKITKAYRKLYTLKEFEALEPEPPAGYVPVDPEKIEVESATPITTQT